MTVDAFARGALGVDRLIEETAAIEQHPHQAALLPIEVFDAAAAFGELGMLTDLACPFGKQERTAKALSAIAIGVHKPVGGMHTQAARVTWGPIGVARHFWVVMGAAFK